MDNGIRNDSRSSETCWRTASSTDTRLFPFPVLACVRQRPEEGHTGFESTNGGGGGNERRERWTTEVCVFGNTVTSGQKETGSMEHKKAETKSARKKSEAFEVLASQKYLR